MIELMGKPKTEVLVKSAGNLFKSSMIEKDTCTSPGKLKPDSPLK